MRRVIMALAVVGVWLSVRALQVHYSTGLQPCSINDVWDCGIVNHSPYAVMFGVPVALIGIIGYALLAVVAGLNKMRLLAAGAVAGLGFSLYLTHIEASVLGVWCIYCVGSLITISLITVLAIAHLFLSRRKAARTTEERAATSLAK